MQEIEKYRAIYSDPGRWPRYGHTNHGRKALPLVEGASSVVDVGCGHNEFAKELRGAGKHAVGVDFACPGADIEAPADALPFGKLDFEVITAFDMLEHLRPEEVRPVLREFARVSRRFVFSISYVPSVYQVKGETLHPTVKPEDWWIARIEEAGGRVERSGRYLHGEWGEPKAPPVASGESVVMVGNGPGVLGSGLGDRIDQFGQVVRFNHFKTNWFEKDVGVKTTLWSTFGKGTVIDECEKNPGRIIYIHGDNGDPAMPWDEIWRIPLPFYERMKARVREVSERDGERLEKTIASSGLLVAAWLLETVEIGQPLHLAGFDNFKKERSSRHHYWNEKAFGRPVEHDGDAEAVIFARWESEGRVVRL